LKYRYTLKNRPKDNDAWFYEEAIDWFEGFEKEFHGLYLLLRDAYNQLERGQNMDMGKLGSSIRVAFKKSKEILGVKEA